MVRSIIKKLRDLFACVEIVEVKVFGITARLPKQRKLGSQPKYTSTPLSQQSSSKDTSNMITRLGSEVIHRLGSAENHFLEVLITRFVIERDNKGCILTVYFDDDTPAIWNRDGKQEAQQKIHNFTQRAFYYQKKLDAFLLDGKGEQYEHDDPDFFFRYASGGTLPIVEIDKIRYYCLFYRDIFPVGWNIANGGCDTKDELLYPVSTIERELREEMIVVNPKKGGRYIFPMDANKPQDHPDFAVARRLWQKRLVKHNYIDSIVGTIDIKWIEGPDTVFVTAGSEFFTQKVTGCFVNINPMDFGIEIDRIAVINLDEDAVILDGEINENQLVNTVIGLFEIDKLNSDFARSCTDFRPKFFFHDAIRYDGHNIEDIITNRLLPHVAPMRNRYDKELYESSQKKFDLCPITRNIIRRWIQTSNKEMGHGEEIVPGT